MTLEWIKQMLKTSGIGYKQIVLNVLENATIEELLELIHSVNVEINVKSSLGVEIKCK